MGFDEFMEGVWKVEKFVIKTAAAVAITAGVVATGPLAIPLGAAVAVEGYAIKSACEDSNNEAVKEIGGMIGESILDGGVGGATAGVKIIKK